MYNKSVVLKLGAILDNYHIFKFRALNRGKGSTKLIMTVCVIHAKFTEMTLFITSHGVYH